MAEALISSALALGACGWLDGFTYNPNTGPMCQSLGYHRFTFPGDRYPFTAGWIGSWVYEKSPPLIFHCAQDSNLSSLGCELSVLPLHHTAQIFVPGSGPPTQLTPGTHHLLGRYGCGVKGKITHVFSTPTWVLSVVSRVCF